MHVMLKMETMKWENTKIRVSCADVFSPLLCVSGDSRCAFPIYVTEAPQTSGISLLATYTIRLTLTPNQKKKLPSTDRIAT